MKKFLPVLGIVSLLLLISEASQATHLRAGEIRAERISCSGLTYRITLIIYTNMDSPSHPGGTAGGTGVLRWGSNSVTVPFLPNPTVINAALGIARVTYTREISFPAEGTYIISYEEADRNASTINIPNQNDDISFYVENRMVVSRTFCDSSPSFLVPPVDQGCKGKTFYHQPGAIDAEGDSVSYSMTIPKGDNGVTIVGYFDPNDPKFYSGTYPTGNMNGDGPPTFGIHPSTGLLTWDAPGAIGAYNIAIKVTQWKKNPADSTWFEFGYVIRDMQIGIVDCSNNPPDLVQQQDLCVLAGENLTLDIKGIDIDFNDVSIEIFSDITTFAESPAVVKYAGLVQSTAVDTAHIILSWTPDCIRVRAQPYQVVLKITDAPVNGVKLIRFRSFTIKVMGPPPLFNDVVVNPVAKKVTLQWDAYACQNAQAIQVWRRVARKQYLQPPCETGMQKSLRYVLLTELPGNATSYVDGDLAIGAEYCYRIVARFADVASKISLDTCLIPQPAKAPVITHVTVKKTDAVAGEIHVLWTPPFEIDAVQYPPPYQYTVQRGNGFEGGDWTTVTTMPLIDTVFTDTTIPTRDTAYHYRILLNVPSVSTTTVDTSSVASSVKLESVASMQGIHLAWDARVPWSVYLESHPYHYIYRSETGDENDFVLIDSTEVSEDGFVYVDQGQFQDQPLDDHTIYFYKVTTTGGYGNPNILEPLFNDSQVIHNHLIDNTPPCAPVVHVVNPDCDKLPCATSYTSTVQWNTSTAAGCANDDDIVHYEVYVSDTRTGSFVVLTDDHADSTLIQNNLVDLSACYKVIAVDWVGNKSALSEAACGENCPVVYMPNVFTPGVSPEYNDTFHAFSATGNILNKECSRFISHMSLTIINRYGEEIFSTASDNISNVYWDGKGKAGQEMSSGVYYYRADVQLKYSAERKETQQVKGWVHLMR